jgi:hypothetical protein
MPDKPDALTAAKAPPAGVPDKVPVPFGIVPASIDEAFRLASALARSGLVPVNYRGKPDDILTAMQLGAEIGLAPMQALQSIAVIDGKPTVWGDGLLAVVQASPLYVSHAEYYEVVVTKTDADPVKPIITTTIERRDNLTAGDLADDATRAVCVFWRRGQADPTIRTFSIAQAKRAGKWGKNVWATYPDRMLQMRARSWAARDTFADVLKGIDATEAIDDPTPPAPAEPRRVPRLSDPHDFVDRTNLTRHDDDPAADVPDPGPITVDLGPASIVALDEHRPPDDEMFWTITLDTGELVDTIHADRAAALRPYVGTAYRFLMSCTRDGSALDLVGWALVKGAE